MALLNLSIIIFIIWQGESEHSDWFFLGQDFAIWTVSIEPVIGCFFFCFSKAGQLKASMARVPYNKLLTNLASLPYWGILALGRFCTDLTSLGPYCHNLRPIFPSTALWLSYEKVLWFYVIALISYIIGCLACSLSFFTAKSCHKSCPICLLY